MKQSLKARLAPTVIGLELPGLIAAHGTSDSLDFACFGFRDIAAQSPVSSKTLFPLASVSKQFTAVAVLMLVDQKLLSLTDPLSKFVKFEPRNWGQVTVHSLLSHTSGLPDYLHGNLNFKKDTCPEDILHRLSKRALRFAPETKWEYSNSGYVALGHIVSEVTGTNFSDFVIDQIIRPAGMASTTVASRVPQGVAAKPYVREGDVWSAPAHVSVTYLELGDGMLSSSVTDLQAWHRALMSRRFLKPETWLQAWTPHQLCGSTGYGFGWQLDRPGSTPRLSHRGEFEGSSSFLCSDLASDSFVCYLVNTDDTDLLPLEQLLLSTLS